jgi:DNA-directed RNA polymerase II subunit RPB1
MLVLLILRLFDGDEMNMHVPQSIQTAAELKELASVETQIITPANHKPIIALVQDSIIGSYLFTRYDNYLTKKEVLDLLAWNPCFDGILPEPEIISGENIIEIKKKFSWFPYYKYINNFQDIDDNEILRDSLWTGRQIFSLVIPDINLEKNNDSFKNASVEDK